MCCESFAIDLESGPQAITIYVGIIDCSLSITSFRVIVDIAIAVDKEPIDRLIEITYSWNVSLIGGDSNKIIDTEPTHTFRDFGQGASETNDLWWSFLRARDVFR